MGLAFWAIKLAWNLYTQRIRRFIFSCVYYFVNATLAYNCVNPCYKVCVKPLTLICIDVPLWKTMPVFLIAESKSQGQHIKNKWQPPTEKNISYAPRLTTSSHNLQIHFKHGQQHANTIRWYQTVRTELI